MSTDDAHAKVDSLGLRADDAELLKRISDNGAAPQSTHQADTDSLNRLIAAGHVARDGGGFLQGAPTYRAKLDD